MLVKTQELTEGCILIKDIFAKTNRPLITKNTVFSEDLIQFLQAFLIDEVEISNTKVTGGSIQSTENVLEESEKKNRVKANIKSEKEIERNYTFSEQFLKGAQDFKREFKSWQAGGQVDITVIRKIILPLVERSSATPADIFSLHHFSTEQEYLYQHSIAVGLVSGFIGKKMNFSSGDIAQIAVAGCLADCGMAKVPINILNKKSALTRDEFEEIKNHPTYSYKMIQNSSLIRKDGKIAIYQHHERLDGSGYPNGDKGSKIHIFSKIIAIADTFHAMTSARLYRKKQSPFKVLEMMLQDSFGKFDIASIQALQSGIMNFSIGSKVRLSNGQIAEIIFIGEKSPTRPLVKLIETEEIIHLEKNREIFIEEVL